MTRKSGFTLVELLVVIGVIAILAAILFPAFARSRRSALRTQCASNIHQIGLALQAYTQDWEERYPAAYCPDAYYYHQQRPSLKQVLASYTLSAEIWKCPEDIGETFTSGRSAGVGHRTPPFYTESMCGESYSWPGLGAPFDGAAPRTLSSLQVYSVRKPAATVLVWESRPWHGDYRADGDYFQSPALYNVGYCDGHIAREPQSVWYRNQMTAFW